MGLGFMWETRVVVALRSIRCSSGFVHVVLKVFGISPYLYCVRGGREKNNPQNSNEQQKPEGLFSVLLESNVLVNVNADFSVNLTRNGLRQVSRAFEIPFCMFNILLRKILVSPFFFFLFFSLGLRVLDLLQKLSLITQQLSHHLTF